MSLRSGLALTEVRWLGEGSRRGVAAAIAISRHVYERRRVWGIWRRNMVMVMSCVLAAMVWWRMERVRYSTYSRRPGVREWVGKPLG